MICPNSTSDDLVKLHLIHQDVIGSVVRCFDTAKKVGFHGMECKRRTMQIEDPEGNSIYVTLFDEYEEQFSKYTSENKDVTTIVIILQCSKKVLRKVITIPKGDGSDEFEEQNVFEYLTPKCAQEAVSAEPRIKLGIRVQDATGMISLTLFDGEANRIFRKSTKEFLEKYLEGGYNRLLPDEFYDLMDKKYAFKIEITDFNLKTGKQVYTIAKMTDDSSIIGELEIFFTSNEVDDYASMNAMSVDVQSQETDVVSFCGDNGTPISDLDKNPGKRPCLNEKKDTFKADNELKRSLCHIYDVDEEVSFSATKARPTGAGNVKRKSMLIDNATPIVFDKENVTTHISIPYPNHGVQFIDRNRDMRSPLSNITIDMSTFNGNRITNESDILHCYNHSKVLSNSNTSTFTPISASSTRPSRTRKLKRNTLNIPPFPNMDLTLQEEVIDGQIIKNNFAAISKDLKENAILGQVQAVVYTVEFQKRGLPHAHVCLFMHPDHKLPTVEYIDPIITAEIPEKNEDPELYSLVKEFMIHGPCGNHNLNCPCMIDNKCSKKFPKRFCANTTIDGDGFPVYRRRDYGTFVEKSGVKLDNRSVVPYNKLLLKRYQAHINVEWCNQAGSIKYLFKYINKGPDRATLLLEQSNKEDDNNEVVDEIQEYYDCRYLSACEATWRLSLTDDRIQNLTLFEIEKLLLRNSSSLRRFPSMPYPDNDSISSSNNRLITEELSYDRNNLQTEFDSLLVSLTDEQRSVFEEIMNAVKHNKGGVFFVYGYGGTGKTFLWRTLSAAIRCKGQIVLNVASSGIASLLLTGGRTTHSRFLIPLNLNEDSLCYIKPGSDVAHLLQQASLIIWDEAPMIHKHAFEALDRTMKDILMSDEKNNSKMMFGGKVVVFGGDFRQILPVIPNGSRNEIVNACLSSSYIWKTCRVLKLTKNMRLSIGSEASNIEQTKMFSNWLLDLGEGKVGDVTDGESIIDIPEDILITNSVDPISALIDFIYPSILENFKNLNFFQERAILAPTNEVVQDINDRLLSLFPGEEKEYLSSDTICQSDFVQDNFDESLYSPDVLNGLKLSGLPNHKLVLKVGVPVMLLRNIDQKCGLCNGTRLQMISLGNRVIEAEIISGSNIGTRTFIPRLSLTPSDKRIPFKFKRRQFPLAVCFAMTINKSQGQSLSRVGLYLKHPVFTHGQLYVALSRVKSREGLKLLIIDKEGKVTNKTTNVVYKEVFGNV
ncbi:hypothetical protein L1987_81342 [Smallanthus sonchifolius]|uniref:Uncharacterized protein n=1 Tax=Smallanthus sonchifolius TaxID=185202 RepID=A0ACB8YQT9_9ASTR|nr:hypothetical protein L1987_81342 [Smallanthus sonchifolius]